MIRCVFFDADIYLLVFAWIAIIIFGVVCDYISLIIVQIMSFINAIESKTLLITGG
jgi:hypothetical protein